MTDIADARLRAFEMISDQKWNFEGIQKRGIADLMDTAEGLAQWAVTGEIPDEWQTFAASLRSKP